MSLYNELKKRGLNTSYGMLNPRTGTIVKGLDELTPNERTLAVKKATEEHNTPVQNAPVTAGNTSTAIPTTNTSTTTPVVSTPAEQTQTREIAPSELTRNLQDIQKGLTNVRRGLSTLQQPETQDKTLTNLQNSIITALSNELPNLSDNNKTIMDKYNERKKELEKANEASKKIIQENYNKEINLEKQAGERRLTSAEEARRGFATNAAYFKQIEDNTRRRVNDLSKQRDQALAMGDISTADEINKMMVDEQRALTNAKTNYLNSLFGISGELRAERGFETPQQAREQTANLNWENQEKGFIQALKAKYADVPGISEAESLDKIIELISPRLSEDRKNELAQIKADLDLRKAESAMRNAEATRYLSSANGTGTTKPPSEAQLKAAGFAERAMKDNVIFDKLAKVKGFNPTSWTERHLPNFLKSPEMQEQEQAERDFVNAILRQESGAVISPEEFDNASKQYFPQVGDTPEVLKQKRLNRITAINNLVQQGGAAFNNDPLGIMQ